MGHQIYLGNNLDIMEDCIDNESIDLIYIDPPFNTGKTQKLQGNKYEDTFENLEEYLRFMTVRLEEGHRVLKPEGSFFLHVDYRTVHYLKMIMDTIFGIECFQNEIIWAYDFGARQKTKWPTKHDNILWYTKHPKKYTFNFDKMERIPYLSQMASKEKREKGKTPTDVWWHTIVPTMGGERVGYPTQKPLGILKRIVTIHSNIGDTLLDYFAGSGSFGHAAAIHKRSSILIDENPDAIEIIQERLKLFDPEIMEAG